MASVTLKVKISNQSCKQRKRRGRSSGNQITNEKHIGASQVKQRRVTDKPVQAEVLMQGVKHTIFSRTGHWKRAQKDFSTCSAWRDLDLFWILLLGYQPLPHVHTLFTVEMLEHLLCQSAAKGQMAAAPTCLVWVLLSHPGNQIWSGLKWEVLTKRYFGTQFWVTSMHVANVVRSPAVFY